MLTTKHISGDVSIHLDSEQVVLSDELATEIDEIWEREQAGQLKRKSDGQILSVNSFDTRTVRVRVVRYREYIAQMKMPRLFTLLKIRPLAVSGLISIDDRFAIGKRSERVTQDAGVWELIPSGGLSASCISSANPIEAQFLEELYEEVGILATEVRSLAAFIAVEDSKSHVFDIGIRAILNSEIRLSDITSRRRSDEYSTISWVPKEELGRAAFNKDPERRFSDVSRELLLHGLTFE